MTSTDELVEKYKERSNKEAENTVRKIFPEKTIELDDLLNADRFNLSQLVTIKDSVTLPTEDEVSTSVAKKRKLENGGAGDASVTASMVKVPFILDSVHHISSNSKLVNLIQEVKPHIQCLMDYANLLKMWIQFLIPKIEDGNNFGVSIQEETLNQVSQVEQDVASYLDQITRYYSQRGKLVSKIVKYPYIEDYRRTVIELDEKEFITLRLVICELRNQYSSLHDLIMKNLEKIKKPRTQHLEALY